MAGMLRVYFNTKTFDALIDEHGLAVTTEPAEADVAVLGAKTIDYPKFTKLRAVYRFGVGAENVDVEYLKSHGIQLVFPSEHSKEILFEGTANFTVHAILAMVYERAFGDADTWTKDQHAHVGHLNALVIGTGNVGSRVAKKLAVFMPVATYDALTHQPHELQSMVRAADVITVHMPLVEQTRNFFNAEKLSWVKDGAVLVNTARGALFDEDALYEKLSHSSCRAFFDVFWQEPYAGKLKSLGSQKFFMTPHSASNTKAYIRAGFDDILTITQKLRDLNFAIVGFGKMGSIRYETLRSLPGCCVRWIYEVDATRTIPDEVKRAATLDEILHDPEVDVVFVCTPNDRLRDMVVASLTAGKHVFCEKPPGRSVAELKDMMVAEASHSNAKLMFGFNHRQHESMLLAKRRIDAGEFGKILWMRGRYGKGVDKDFFSTWRASRAKAGGGILLDQGIHMLDLFLMFAGDFEEVKAFVSHSYWKNLDIEDNVFAILRNREGVVVSLHSTMTQWRHLFSLEIFLERGYIVINGLKTSSGTYGEEAVAIAKNRTAPPEASWTDEERLVFPVDHSWKRELELFVDAVRNGTPLEVGTSKDALKLMTLVERIYAQQ